MLICRQDEIGTPFRVLGSSKTLEKGTVGLQDRDTTVEVREGGEYLQTLE